MFANYLFHAYDADANGVIDFKEFLLVMSVEAKGSVKDKLKWAFKLYDLDGSGKVTRTEAIEIIQVRRNARFRVYVILVKYLTIHTFTLLVV